MLLPRGLRYKYPVPVAFGKIKSVRDALSRLKLAATDRPAGRRSIALRSVLVASNQS